MNIEDVKKLRNKYRVLKDNAASAVLALIIGECEKKVTAKQPVDVAAVAKKMIESNNEVIVATRDQDRVIALLYENKVLAQLVPRQMPEQELRDIIADMKLRNVGQIMSVLKAEYAGTYDGKLASQIAREYVELS